MSSTREAILAALSVTTLLTSMFALKFRYWNRPKLLVAYATVIGVAEWWGHEYIVPPGAFGYWLPILCFGLSVPIIVAIVLLHRHEHRHGRTEG